MSTEDEDDEVEVVFEFDADLLWALLACDLPQDPEDAEPPA